MIIRQEINILDSILSAASGASATSNEIVQLDTTQYNGSITYYFEVVADTSISLATSVTLRRSGTTTDDATISIPLLTTAYTRLRSASFSPPAGQTQYVVFISNTVGATKNVKAARIIVIQNATSITSTQTQIEIGNNESSTNASLTKLASPKYWTYTAANWDGYIEVFAEATIKSNTSKTTVTADVGASAFTLFNTDISSSSGVATRVRGRRITLTNTSYYMSTKASVTKSAVNIYNGKLIANSVSKGNVIDSNIASVYTNLAIFGGTGVSGETNQAAGQSFTASKSYNLAGIVLFAYAQQSSFGLPSDNLAITLRSTSITGTILATSSSKTNLPALAGDEHGDETMFVFSPTVALTSGTKYYFQVTRSGARDTSNEYNLQKDGNAGYANGGGYTRDNNVWSAESTTFDLSFRTYDDTVNPVTKIEAQYLLLNTKSTSTGLQIFNTLHDATNEWVGITNTYKHAQDAIGAGANSRLKDIDNGNAILTNSSITGANEQIGSAITDMPSAAHQIDTDIVNIGTEVDASRILVLVTPVATVSAAPTHMSMGMGT